MNIKLVIMFSSLIIFISLISFAISKLVLIKTKTKLVNLHPSNIFSFVRSLSLKFLNKIFIVININKVPAGIKNLRFSFLLIIMIITSLLIRLDFIFNILKGIPYKAEFIIRICSGMYTVISLFLLIIGLKYCILLSKNYFNSKSCNVKIDNSSYYLYILYFSYILFANIILFILNYYSIVSLDILYLEFIFISLSFISLIIGIYYTIYKHKSTIDLNNSLSLPTMICLISIMLLYLALLIGIKFNLFSEFISKWENLEIIKKVYCEGSSADGGTNNINSKLKAPEDGKITPGSSKNNFTNSSYNIVAGDNSTISNVNINPAKDSSSTPYVRTTTKKEVFTSTVLVEGIKSNFRSVSSFFHKKEEISSVYGSQDSPFSTSASQPKKGQAQYNSSNNSSNSNIAYYIDQATGMFKNPLKGHSANNSIRFSGKVLNDSPLLREGIAGIITNLDQFKDLPVARTQNNTPLSQLSDLPQLTQVSSLRLEEEVSELPLTLQEQSKWSNNMSLSLNKNKELPPIPFCEEEVKPTLSNKFLSLFKKGKMKETIVSSGSEVGLSRSNQQPVGLIQGRNLSEISEIASYGFSQLPVMSSQSKLPLLNSDSMLPIASSKDNLFVENSSVPVKHDLPYQLDQSLEIPNKGIYDVTFNNGKVVKKSKSLPNIFKKENIISDLPYIKRMLWETLGKSNPAEYFSSPQDNWIEYDNVKNHKRGFIFMQYDRNVISFDLIPAKNKNDLILYLKNSGDKYPNKDLMIDTVEANQDFVKLLDINMIYKPNIHSSVFLILINYLYYKDLLLRLKYYFRFKKPSLILSNFIINMKYNKWKI